MPETTLSGYVETTAAEFGIPGVAVGVWAGGRESYACHGVTSLDNPLPVDRDTLYVVGSVTKTFTATAVMRLVAEGRVDLAAPVRRYVPELVLADEEAAAAVTVLNLLNHTAGLDWGLILDTGEGDDALAKYVAKLSELPLVAPPGTRASYSQAGYNLAGRVLEKVTGTTYENAVVRLVLEPAALSHSFFHRDDIMTRRFAAGHNPGGDGTPAVARLWRRWRGDNPGGGLASSVADLIRWARYHLDDGTLHGMRRPTVALRGSNLGSAIGIGWFLRDLDGVRLVGHGGSANGQFAELLTVPEHDFAVATLANAGPNGIPFNQAVVRWVLRTYLSIEDRDPQPVGYDHTWVREVVGRYDTEAQTVTVATDGTGLTLAAGIKPEIRAAAETELPPDYPPAGIGQLPGGTDEYIVTTGGLRGLRGYFTRGETGEVVGLDLAGRLYLRVPAPEAGL